MRRMRVILLFIVICTLTSFAQQPGNERFVRVINRLVEAMNKQDYAGIVHEYDAGMTAAFPLNNTTLLFKNYESQLGKVIKVDPPQVKAVDQAVCLIYFERGAQNLTLYITEQEKIKGFIFTTQTIPEPQPKQEPKQETKPAPTQTTAQTTTPPPAVEPKPATAQTSEKPSNPVQTPTIKEVETGTPEKNPVSNPIPAQPVAPLVTDKQQTEIFPPFKGSWAVIFGGEVRSGAAQNNLLLQQYAYEFSAKDTAGLRYRKDGKTNEDYIGQGKDVLAPAQGTVVEVIDGIRDNSPGLRNPYAPIGNAVIIQHTNREYSVLSFLKQGSTRVKVGDKVTRGQIIAQCGNSGNATEPVIHYHLQDSPFLQTAKGVKFYFERATVTKEGKKELKLIHLPEIGETIDGE
jgi:murein DD-endopeptidase MepM/ murein hydrolase activator NlpD